MINSVTARENLTNKTYDTLLEDIYVDKSLVDYHRERYIKAIKQYETLFCQDEISVRKFSIGTQRMSAICLRTDNFGKTPFFQFLILDLLIFICKSNADKVIPLFRQFAQTFS